MEAIFMGRQVAVPKRELFPVRLGFRLPVRVRTGRFGFSSSSKRYSSARLKLKCVRAETAMEKNEASIKKKHDQTGPCRLFVGLPLDSVSKTNTVNHGKAISAGLRALKLLGTYGVELPVFWAVAQPETPDKFDWSGYLSVANMARSIGLQLRVSLCVHGCSRPEIPLPDWVSRAAKADLDMLFTDKSGGRHADCLSFAVDELPVLEGKKPIEVFEGFFTSFRSAFSEFFGSTIMDVTISLGPNGELRYPSFPPASGSHRFTGVGEFQCYDKYTLASLKQHADQSGHNLWGLSGPHDAPHYNQSPDSANFFKENGGSWETPYGEFFLSWYSKQLLDHSDRVLSIASKVFADLPVQLSAKVPLLHWWHGTRSRPAELTAGFYNTDGRDGYDEVVKIFKKHSCVMIIPGMDQSDTEQPQGLRSSPQSLLGQIKKACERNGVEVAGENITLVRNGTNGFGRIKVNLQADGLSVRSFTYQRMGADFFSPEHWPLFLQFMKGMERMELGPDDLPDGGLSLKIGTGKGNDREMQAV